MKLLIAQVGSSLLLATALFSQASAPQSTAHSESGVEEQKGTIYKVGVGIMPPKALYQPPAEYSDEGRAKRISGTVTLKLVITAKGEPKDITILKGLGSGLDEKAMEAVRQWKFKPATKDGKPVAVAVAVEVDFRP